MFLGGLVLMPILIARMRPKTSCTDDPPAESWRQRHRGHSDSLADRCKQHAGTDSPLLVAGMAMLVLPGQGIMTILRRASRC